MEETIYNRLRQDIFLAAYAGGQAPHLASSFSCVDILYALYCKGILRHDPKNPTWEDRDRVILSKGHGSLGLYAVLCEAGYFSRDVLMSFVQSDSLLGGEPSLNQAIGIEAGTGSLGHGLSMGVGMAMAAKVKGSPSHTYVLVGDGECQEGAIWEAVMSASRFHLDNLTILLDHNRLQKMDTVEAIMDITNWKSRFAAFGWNCVEVDGHNIEELAACLENHKTQGKPTVVICHTVKGKGCSLMEENPAWHWRKPNRRELKVFLRELNITEEALAQCKTHT